MCQADGVHHLVKGESWQQASVGQPVDTFIAWAWISATMPVPRALALRPPPSPRALGLRVAARRSRLSGKALEVLVGHATFCGLANRTCLAVLDAVYKFMRFAGEERMPLWITVRRELRAFAGLMGFLHGDWTHGWSPRVLIFSLLSPPFGNIRTAPPRP